MESGSIKSTLHYIRTLYTVGTLGGQSDAQLLELFLAPNGDGAEDAFAALVCRHGPTVLGVCRPSEAATKRRASAPMRDPGGLAISFDSATWIGRSVPSLNASSVTLPMPIEQVGLLPDSGHFAIPIRIPDYRLLPAQNSAGRRYAATVTHASECPRRSVPSWAPVRPSQRPPQR